jgi:hypothetical protein
MIEIRSAAAAALALAIIGVAQPAHAQIANVEIQWEVKNRFRLFAEEKDFLAAEERYKNRKTILEAEQAAGGKDGEGWARHVGRLCFNPVNGLVRDDCERDGRPDRYINPREHQVYVKALAQDGAECFWTFVADGARTQLQKPCSDRVEQAFRYRKPNRAEVEVRKGGAVVARGNAVISVNDVLIVGMGDSVASGEGNPTRKVQLQEKSGFCYFRVNSNDMFYLPARAAPGLRTICPPPGSGGPDEPPLPDQTPIFEKAEAKWLHAPCHRSMYSYQFRAALVRAVEDKHGAVTFVPLACSGATIEEGVLASQPARERPLIGKVRPDRIVESQISALRGLVAPNGKVARLPDVILLTIGANDIGFSGLVANVIVQPDTGERQFLDLADVIVTPDDARVELRDTLPPSFTRLRRALAPFVRNDFKRIVFTTYANPALASADSVCPSGRRGLDSHPAFTVDGAALADTSRFVEKEFIPRLRRVVLCEGNACPPSRAMTYVDAHRPAFTGRGFCANGPGDPAFDRACFLDGSSFRTDLVEAQKDPLVCGLSASAFLPYAPRERWIRTPNDGYFAAMTHPLSTPLKPPSLHDSLWGVSAALYGGAIHPTAEGHAAMADAVLPMLRPVTPAPRRFR